MSIKRKTRPLIIIDRPGPEQYEATLSIQTNLLEARVKDETLPNTLILLEHDHVYTVGRSVPFPEVLSEKAKPVKWVEIGRGGKATYHGPGQLVAYPIFSLEHFGKDVHVFLRKLEDVIIAVLSHFEIRGVKREGLTGVWVESTQAGFPYKKIAAIGIGVRKWVSYHGFSLNVSPDLDYFHAISACGQEGPVSTSMQELMGELCPSVSEVKAVTAQCFQNIFSLHLQDPDDVSAATLGIKKRARPSWLKVKAPGSPGYIETSDIVREHKLVTVCEAARCPNIGECWAHGTATFMIMGDQCTRRCSFCSIKDGTSQTLDPLDPFEPLRVSQAIERLGLRHVVITSVNRDDIKDMGAEHFDKTIKSIKQLNPDCDVEFLIPDMRGRKELVESVLKSGLLKVLNHNVETVPRLYKTVRPGAIFRRSLEVLSWAKEIQPGVKTKSGLMVGLGEEKHEVLEVLAELRRARVDIVTIGQYLQPSSDQIPVYRFVTPEEFLEYEVEAKSLGFSHVESGPLVRSSYHAWKHTGDLDRPRNIEAAL